MLFYQEFAENGEKEGIVSENSVGDSEIKSQFDPTEVIQPDIIPQLDGNLSCSSDDDVPTSNFRLTQLDGHVGTSSQTLTVFKKDSYAISCDFDDIIQGVTFFRGLSLLWERLADHKLCLSSEIFHDCFFCYMRSSCLRLSAKRGRGPKSLKIVEFISQLNQYLTILGWNWRDNHGDVPSFIEKTFQLLRKYEHRIVTFIGLPDGYCQKCRKITRSPNSLVFEVNTPTLTSPQDPLDINYLIDVLIRGNCLNMCCIKNMRFADSEENYLILKLSNPISLDLKKSEEIYGKNNVQCYLYL